MPKDNNEGQDPKELENELSLAQEVWARVFGFSNKIIHSATSFGFYGMDMMENPDVDTMLRQVTLVDVLLVKIANMEEALDEDEIRQIINAQAQLRNMDKLLQAIKNQDKSEFEERLELLKKQAPF